MRFPTPLHRATLRRRYKRFLADIVLEDGREVVAHCPNPGAMTGLAEPGAAIHVAHSADPRRKLGWAWRLTELESGCVGVDTALANRVVAEALAEGALPFAGSVRPEVRYGAGSRVDFLIEGERRLWLEVKSVTLSRRAGLAEFPDTVTKRGARHMGELAAMAQAGDRAAVLFLVMRGDCTAVAPAADIDPAYAAALSVARAAGVEVHCYDCQITPTAVTLGQRLPLA